MRKILVVLFAALLAGGVGFYAGVERSKRASQVQASKIVTSVKNIVELAVIEVNLHQVYDFSKENVKLSAIPDPIHQTEKLSQC